MKYLARLILAAIAAVAISAQNQPKATFEVASVKPNPEFGPPGDIPVILICARSGTTAAS